MDQRRPKKGGFPYPGNSYNVLPSPCKGPFPEENQRQHQHQQALWNPLAQGQGQGQGQKVNNYGYAEHGVLPSPSLAPNLCSGYNDAMKSPARFQLVSEQAVKDSKVRAVSRPELVVKGLKEMCHLVQTSDPELPHSKTKYKYKPSGNLPKISTFPIPPPTAFNSGQKSSYQYEDHRTNGNGNWSWSNFPQSQNPKEEIRELHRHGVKAALSYGHGLDYEGSGDHLHAFPGMRPESAHNIIESTRLRLNAEAKYRSEYYEDEGQCQFPSSIPPPDSNSKIRKGGSGSIQALTVEPKVWSTLTQTLLRDSNSLPPRPSHHDQGKPQHQYQHQQQQQQVCLQQPQQRVQGKQSFCCQCEMQKEDAKARHEDCPHKRQEAEKPKLQALISADKGTSCTSLVAKLEAKRKSDEIKSKEETAPAPATSAQIQPPPFYILQTSNPNNGPLSPLSPAIYLISPNGGQPGQGGAQMPIILQSFPVQTEVSGPAPTPASKKVSEAEPELKCKCKCKAGNCTEKAEKEHEKTADKNYRIKTKAKKRPEKVKEKEPDYYRNANKKYESLKAKAHLNGSVDTTLSAEDQEEIQFIMQAKKGGGAGRILDDKRKKEKEDLVTMKEKRELRTLYLQQGQIQRKIQERKQRISIMASKGNKRKVESFSDTQLQLRMKENSGKYSEISEEDEEVAGSNMDTLCEANNSSSVGSFDEEQTNPDKKGEEEERDVEETEMDDYERDPHCPIHGLNLNHNARDRSKVPVKTTFLKEPIKVESNQTVSELNIEDQYETEYTKGKRVTPTISSHTITIENGGKDGHERPYISDTEHEPEPRFQASKSCPIQTGPNAPLLLTRGKRLNFKKLGKPPKGPVDSNGSSSSSAEALEIHGLQFHPVHDQGIQEDPFPPNFMRDKRAEQRDDNVADKSVADGMALIEDPNSWERNVCGLRVISLQVQFHETQVLERLPSIVNAIQKHIRASGSKLSRQAILTLRDLFTSLGPHFDPYLWTLAERLFSKMMNTNKFIKDDCEGTLAAMVKNCSHLKVAQILENVARKHKNSSIRLVACKLITKFIDLVGAEMVLEEYGELVLPLLCNNLVERMGEIRDEARNALRRLVREQKFDRCMRQFVSPQFIFTICEKLERIRDEASTNRPRQQKVVKNKPSFFKWNQPKFRTNSNSSNNNFSNSIGHIV